MIAEFLIEKLTLSSQEIKQMTFVQLPVKNHLFLYVSSDDIYQVVGDRE